MGRKPILYEIGYNIKDKKRDLTVIDREHVKVGETTPNGGKSKDARWWYKVRCNKDRYEYWRRSSDFKKSGCPCCANQIAVEGKNTIWDTHRYLVTDFGLDEEFAKTHTTGTHKKGKFACPDCGEILPKYIGNVIKTKSIGCICGDGISYPEKLGYDIFSQLPVEFEYQYSPDYFNKERSDFYFPSLNLAVEFDGELGHEGGRAFDGNEETLKECIKIDKWKTKQHKKHGIKTIRIDCLKSDLEYIKNNILSSELVDYFDFSNVDWLKAQEFALKNIVKEVCDYYNEHEGITTSGLSKAFPQIKSKTTIIKYLKNGTKIGWCNYDSEEELIRNVNQNKKNYIVISPDGTKHKEGSRKAMADYLGVSADFIFEHSDGKPYKVYYKKYERLNGIRIFTKELFIKEFGEEEYNKL